MTARILPDGPEGRTAAAEVLRRGGLVALPTDTVYGIAVALATPGGIERLFAAKARPPDKAIMLLLADPDQADTIGVMTPAARVLAAAGWPGGLTLVLAQRPGVPLPAILTAGTATIGVRVPDHPAPRTIAAAVGPLPATSANRSGRPPASTAAEILDELGDTLDLVLDGGPAPGAQPSTIVDCSTDRPRLLRDGAIPATALAAVLDEAELPHGLGDGLRGDPPR